MAYRKWKCIQYDDLLTLTLPMIRRGGKLADGGQGVILWGKPDAPAFWSQYALTLVPDSADSSILLTYMQGGQPGGQWFNMEFRSSNLCKKGGIWYFVCPDTGKRCRTLYLYKGRFRSRHAIDGAYYYAQTRSTKGRWWDRALILPHRYRQSVKEVSGVPYRKNYYRDKPTPATRRFLRLRAKVNRYSPQEVFAGMGHGKTIYIGF